MSVFVLILEYIFFLLVKTWKNFSKNFARLGKFCVCHSLQNIVASYNITTKHKVEKLGNTRIQGLKKFRDGSGGTTTYD